MSREQWDNGTITGPYHRSIGPSVHTCSQASTQYLSPGLPPYPLSWPKAASRSHGNLNLEGGSGGGRADGGRGRGCQHHHRRLNRGGRGALRKRKLSTCPIMVFSPALCAWLPVHVEILGAAVHVEHEGLCGHLVDDLHGIRAWDQVRVKARVGNGGCRKERWPEQGHQYGTCCDPHFLAGHWTSLNSDPEGHRFSNLPGEAPQNP